MTEYKLNKNGVRILDNPGKNGRQRPKCLPQDHKWIDTDSTSVVRTSKCVYCGEQDIDTID